MRLGQTCKSLQHKVSSFSFVIIPSRDKMIHEQSQDLATLSTCIETIGYGYMAALADQIDPHTCSMDSNVDINLCPPMILPQIHGMSRSQAAGMPINKMLPYLLPLFPAIIRYSTTNANLGSFSSPDEAIDMMSGPLHLHLACCLLSCFRPGQRIHHYGARWTASESSV